jgi:hypothetical protein
MIPIEQITIRKEGSDWVIVDKDNDHQENAILLTLGHPMTDFPDEYIMTFAAKIIHMWNGTEDVGEEGKRQKLIDELNYLQPLTNPDKLRRLDSIITKLKEGKL